MDWTRYGIYHARWQLSTILLTGPLVLFGELGFGRPVSLALSQFIGAVVFWHVDAWIFDDQDVDD